MKSNILIIWAVGATATALLLAGILIGKSLDTQEASMAGPTASEPGGVAEVDRYQVPAWLENASKEWRSPYTGENHGYAILFDYDHRELLVEHCNHDGFFDVKKNLPTDRGRFQCNRLLTASLVEFNEAGVLAKRKSGSPLQVNASRNDRGEFAVLNLQFDNHNMELVPGQPNDLLQEIVGTPEMNEQKALLFEFNEQQVRQERARLMAANDANKEGPPRIVLSKAALEKEEQARQADLNARTQP